METYKLRVNHRLFTVRGDYDALSMILLLRQQLERRYPIGTLVVRKGVIREATGGYWHDSICVGNPFEQARHFSGETWKWGTFRRLTKREAIEYLVTLLNGETGHRSIRSALKP